MISVDFIDKEDIGLQARFVPSVHLLPLPPQSLRGIAFRTCRMVSSRLTSRTVLANSLMSTFFSLLLRRYEGTARLPRIDSFY